MVGTGIGGQLLNDSELNLGENTCRQRKNEEKLVEMVTAGRLAPPNQVRQGVPRPLAAICLKAMSVQPSERYATALEMAIDLEKYLADARVSVHRDSLGTRFARVIRKNRTASLLILALFVLSSFFLTLGLIREGFMARRAEQLADERLRTSANMAALIGGLEIDRRFSLLEAEAQQPAMVAAIQDVLSQPLNRSTWERPQSLLFKLNEKLAQKEIKIESIFVTDARGTQIARVPESDANGKIESIGSNFAYRQYFHGQAKDLDVESDSYQTNPPPPCLGKVLSNAYVSTNRSDDGQFVKTSFSVAITDVDQRGDRRILGRLGISFGVNELGIFRILNDVTVDAFVIESRQYELEQRNARGLALDRRQRTTGDRSPFVSAPSEFFSSEFAEVALGLSANSVDQIFSLLPSNGDAVVLPGFSDPGLGIENRDVAIAQVRVPSDDSLNVWSVLLVEQTQD